MTDSHMTLFDLQQAVDTFLEERDWYQFHNPKVDSMGPVVESSELLSLFLFSKQGTGGQDILLAKRESVEDELSDVLNWVICFSLTAKIDLVKAIFLKIESIILTDTQAVTLADLKKVISILEMPQNAQVGAMNISCKAAHLMHLFSQEAEESVDSTGVELLAHKRNKIELLLADVLIALIQFAEVTSIDLSTAFLRKIEKNAKKYPIEKSKGKSTKYIDL